jgi:GxxExxY protein
MDANQRESLNHLVEMAVGAAYEVSNVLGAGFLEKVYERAMVIELKHRGIKAEAQSPVNIRYKKESVGDYFVDILVEKELIVELKCVESLSEEHLAQTLNYLKATGLHIALLINFQHPKVEWKRVVLDF